MLQIEGRSRQLLYVTLLCFTKRTLNTCFI